MTNDDWTADFCEAPQRSIGPVKTKRGPTPASILRRDTIKAIQGLKYLGSRPVVIPVYTGIAEHGGIKYQVGRLGASDLVVGFVGRLVAIELKAGADKQSERQKKFEMRVNQADCMYVIVHKPQDAVDALVRVYNQHVAKLQPRA